LNKCKVFSAFHEADLERSVNDWLMANPNIKVLSSSCTMAAGGIILFVTMIIYREFEQDKKKVER
jgi:hypothetical protein